MFLHIFKYRLKCLLRDKEVVFWTMFFPLILATLFMLAFSNLTAHDNFNPISIAVIDNDAYNRDAAFKSTLESISEGDDRLFDLSKATEPEASSQLTQGDIKAIILLDPEISLVVNESGISQNIVKIFLDNYSQISSAVSQVLETNPAGLQAVLDNFSEELSLVKEVPISDNSPNIILVYFYSLLAMACMYGAFWGHREVMEIQANLTPLAARINLVPVHKFKTFIASILAALVIQFFELLVLMGYLQFVLGLDFGNRIGYILFTCLIGSIAGITFGSFISSTMKTGEGSKIAVLLGVTMLGSFLAGMMFDKMKYIVATEAPILSYINPVNLLSDAFYALYYFDSFDRYWTNMGYLSIMIVVFSIGTYLVVRRQKYASL